MRNTSTIGALHELIVSVDLMDKGYEVFRALSPATSCDLLAAKDGKLYRVEVTTGRKHEKTGEIYWPGHDANRYDILAVVFERKVTYYGLPA